MTSRVPSGITIPEFAVFVGVLLVAFAIAGSYFGQSIIKGCGPARESYHMRTLHLATLELESENRALGLTNSAWPGDNGSSFAAWATALVERQILSTRELTKLLSTKGIAVPPDRIPTTNNTAILVYAVRANSPSNAVFLTSANFTNTPAGGVAPARNSKPLGHHGFYVFTKDGNLNSFGARNAGDPELIGTYVPLCQ